MRCSGLSSSRPWFNPILKNPEGIRTISEGGEKFIAEPDKFWKYNTSFIPYDFNRDLASLENFPFASSAR